MQPRYPIFIPTKGRYKTPYTIRLMQRLNIPFTAVVEATEWEEYSKVVPPDKILVLPHRDKGLTVTRNWIWDYAQDELHTPYFWTFDDNIRDFYRLHKNMKYRWTSGTPLAAMEDFAERYSNLAICGMNYEMFAPRKQRMAPVILNTRVYSNMLIRTNIPFRNELFFNDDTDLCIRVLKAGWCVVQFNVFLAQKIHTMVVKGGMTDYYEQTDKRKQFAEELRKAHPDIVKTVWKFNRWHHQVDYRQFKNNRLKLKPDVEIPDAPNEYGMRLVEITNGRD